jgi:hypothetical protein
VASTVHTRRASDELSPVQHLAALADRINDLQTLLAAVEAKLSSVSGSQCPKCKAFPLRLIDSGTALRVVGALHGRAWIYRCAK